jgi:hypothetical protein
MRPRNTVNEENSVEIKYGHSAEANGRGAVKLDKLC